ncbi:MAG: polysaccharide deacetylase family protein [Agathobaculum sp.]|uniref:polysaccharide deacetylase family protein n=1 Tax=Agathobaculum sp. TaxID=2048138 RepID=UPI0025C6C979|nr:polysaccharide deacetylase family protein [Agathobaculum sp.]MCI7126387.1 polysaccharide deacetylase family protein [Agathobaculum sp.]MDY3712522.1 polysaccharide deacetylase family protein [Agathobaculum sp.]
MRLGFRHTALQAVCTVLVLCAAIGLLRREEARMVFGDGERVRVPILMYHSILKDGARQGKYVVSPDVLVADLDGLQKRGYQTVTVTDLLAYVQQGTPLPEKPVMITFDDGYYNNFVYAYPLLQERGMRAVVSVIGCQTALYSQNGQENPYWSHVTLDHLKQMQDVFEVQNHSWNLHEYGERRGCLRRRGEDKDSYEHMLREDTEQTQRLLTEAGLPTPACYTYPFGACSEESERVIRDMGFLCTLGCEERVNVVTRQSESLYGMGRYNRPAGESTEHYLERVLNG